MAAAMSSTACWNACSLRADGARNPLILRTYWRAAASASPVVAAPASSPRRSWRMLRHMPPAYRRGRARVRDGSGSPRSRRRRRTRRSSRRASLRTRPPRPRRARRRGSSACRRRMRAARRTRSGHDHGDRERHRHRRPPRRSRRSPRRRRAADRERRQPSRIAAPLPAEDEEQAGDRAATTSGAASAATIVVPTHRGPARRGPVAAPTHAPMGTPTAGDAATYGCGQATRRRSRRGQARRRR